MENSIYKKIYETFDIFFENKNLLSEFSEGRLAEDFIHFNKLIYPSPDKEILHIILFFRKAKNTSSVKLYKCMSTYCNDILEAQNKHISMVNLQLDLSKLNRYDYIITLFSYIENYCENNIKLYLKYIYQISTIIQPEKEIKNKSFGNIITSVTEISTFSTLFNTETTGLELNQWRNISCHKSFSIKKEIICCKYGNKQNKTYHIEKKEDLLTLFNLIQQIGEIISLSFDLFMYDNYYEILKIHNNNGNTIFIRDEVWQNLYKSEINILGFELERIKILDKNLTVVLFDLTDNSPFTRQTEIPKLILKLYKFYPKFNKITLLYKDKNKIPIVIITTTLEFCIKFNSGEDIETLFHLIKIHPILKKECN
jgi:hypothetical protein